MCGVGKVFWPLLLGRPDQVNEVGLAFGVVGLWLFANIGVLIILKVRMMFCIRLLMSWI